MSKELDKLFKDKLADHELTAPSQAWTRIESGLSKKNRRPLLMRVAAASLALVAFASTLVWLTSQNTVTPSKQLSGNKTNVGKPVAAVPTQKENKQKRSVLVDQRHEKKASLKKTVEPVPAKEVKMQDVKTDGKTQPDDRAPIEQLVPTEEVKLVAATDFSEKPVVIEFRLESVESSAPKETSPAVADAKEKSGFRKVIDFAMDAKTSSPLGELRDAKDGLFAFNFKKDKQKNAK